MNVTFTFEVKSYFVCINIDYDSDAMKNDVLPYPDEDPRLKIWIQPTVDNNFYGTTVDDDPIEPSENINLCTDPN